MPRPVDLAMLIDDSEIDLFIHRRFLELSNFCAELVSHRSAETALEWLKNLDGHRAPNVIFLDLNMPVVDGFAFLEHFKSLPETITGQSRIVVLTSSNSIADREQVFLHTNVVKMITKPIKQTDIDALWSLVGQ